MVLSIEVCVNTKATIFPGVGVSSNLPQGQTVPCSEMQKKKTPNATAQTPQASVILLNVKVHDSSNR